MQEGGTSNLFNHLKAKQPVTHTKAVPRKCSLCRSKLPWVRLLPPARANRITMLITKFVTRDLRPISTVNGKGFQQLLRFVEPGYKMPSRPYLTITCCRLCSSLKEQLLETLASCNVAITTNLWISKATEGYLTVTAHSCSHCAMCSKWLQEATSKWNVEGRVVAVVWDNSGNMEGTV